MIESWAALIARLRSAFGGDPRAPEVLDAAALVPSGFSRRHFLRAALIGLTAAATVDVEQLLWTPGETTVFLPETFDPAFISVNWITRETLRILRNNLTIANAFTRQYDLIDVPQQHVTIEIAKPRSFAMTPDRYRREVLKPAADQIATAVREQGWTSFAELPIPQHVGEVARWSSAGLSVRGIQQFDILEARDRLRLDIAGE